LVGLRAYAVEKALNTGHIKDVYKTTWWRRWTGAGPKAAIPLTLGWTGFDDKFLGPFSMRLQFDGLRRYR
jgi:hypothetical protein